MIFPGPTAAEERSGVLHERVRGLRKLGVVSDAEAFSLLERWPLKWRTQTPLLAVVFFVLTCIGILAVNGLAELLSLPRGPLLLVGCLGTAEFLIRRLNLFSTGVETALVIGGMVSFITSLPSEGKPEALLVFAAAALITAWRVHSAFFGSAATLLVLCYVAVKSDENVLLPLVAAGAIVTICAALLLSVRSRPWIERLLAFVMIPTIPAAYVAVAIALRGHESPGWLSVVFGASGICLLAIGLAARHHAHLIAGGLALAVAVIEAWKSLPGDDTARFIAIGVTLLGLSLLIERFLRGRIDGIVVTPMSLTPVDEALNLAAAAVAGSAHHHHEPVAAEVEPIGGGGASGGAGATGSF